MVWAPRLYPGSPIVTRCTPSRLCLSEWMYTHQLAAASTAWRQHSCMARRTGIDGRRGGRTRRPLLTADMGYNPKNGFAELLLDSGYSPVVRYPKHWTVEYPSTNPPGAPDGPLPGPLQHAGAFFCPAVISASVDTAHSTPKNSSTRTDSASTTAGCKPSTRS